MHYSFHPCHINATKNIYGETTQAKGPIFFKAINQTLMNLAPKAIGYQVLNFLVTHFKGGKTQMNLVT